MEEGAIIKKSESRKIKSHIQMPKFMLRQFENEEKSLFMYEISSGMITTEHAININVEEGYYSEDTEKILCQSIEQPFSRIMHYIKKIDFDDGSFQLIPGVAETTKLFLNALLARNPNNTKKVRETSVFIQLLNPQSQRDISVLTGINEAEKLGFFDKYFLTFTVNKSKQPFVLPMCGFYWFNNGKNLNLPINPWLAISLVDENILAKLIDDNTIRMYAVDKETDVNKLNHIAYIAQKSQGYGMIVAPEREALARMLMFEETEGK